MSKFIVLFFFVLVGFSSLSKATDSRALAVEAEYLSSKIKKGVTPTPQEINERVDKCSAKSRIMPYDESQLQKMITDLKQPENVEEEYRLVFTSFVKNLKSKFQELLEEGCVEPLFAILLRVVADLSAE